MFKKSYLMALSLCCVAGLTVVGCGNDSQSSKTVDCTMSVTGGNINCNAANVCTLTLDKDSSVSLQVAVSCGVAPSSNTTVTASAVSGLDVNGQGATSSVVTDEYGTAKISVKATGSDNARLTIAALPSVADEVKAVVDVTINSVPEDDPDEQTICEQVGCYDGMLTSDPAYNACVSLECVEAEKEIQFYDLGIKVSYAGEYAPTFADATLFAGKKCTDIVKDSAGALIPDQISNLTVNGGRVGASSNAAGINNLDISIAHVEESTDKTAIIVRGSENGKYVAYGCAELAEISDASHNVTVTLKDAKIEKIVDLCHDYDCTNNQVPGKTNYDVCIKEGCISPDPVDSTYSGSYNLQSQFDALGLLPRSTKEKPLFTEMLVGDWINWSLDLIKDPAEKVPAIITDQVLPLVLSADWLQKMITMVAGDAVAALLNPEMISTLLDQFGVQTIIESYISQFLGQFEWWSVTNNIVTIIDNIARNFTLAGYFKIMENPSEAGILPSNYHSYNALVYNGAKFADAEGNIKCFFGTKIGEDDDKNVLCSVPLGELDKEIGTINGAFTASLNDCSSDDYVSNVCATATIDAHSLSMAYGRILYSVIMKALPSLIGEDARAHVNSIGTLIEYYGGFGLVTLWNNEAEKFNTEHADEIAAGTVASRTKIASDVTMCSGIATAGSKFVGTLLEKTKFAGVLDTWVTPATLTPLCSMGINKIDELINNGLNKLNVGSEKVQFKSNGNCSLKYDGSDLVSFGPENYVWGQKTDTRCGWDLSLRRDVTVENVVDTGEVDEAGNPITKTETTTESKVYTVPGKFFATRIGK